MGSARQRGARGKESASQSARTELVVFAKSACAAGKQKAARSQSLHTRSQACGGKTKGGARGRARGRKTKGGTQSCASRENGRAQVCVRKIGERPLLFKFAKSASV
jgi:hypothetical protein